MMRLRNTHRLDTAFFSLFVVANIQKNVYGKVLNKVPEIKLLVFYTYIIFKMATFHAGEQL